MKCPADFHRNRRLARSSLQIFVLRGRVLHSVCRRNRRDRSRSPYSSHSHSRRKSRSISPRRRRKSHSRSPRRQTSRSLTLRRYRRRQYNSTSLSPIQKSRSPSLGSVERRNASEKLKQEEEERQRRQQEAELKLIEEESAKRVEAAIQKKVAESLESVEIKLEIQRCLEVGRKKVNEEVAAQLEKEKKAALIEARKKEELAHKEKGELERMLEENRRRIEEAQRTEALEQQRREEERYRELEEMQRQKEQAMRRKKQQEEEEKAKQMPAAVFIWLLGWRERRTEDRSSFTSHGCRSVRQSSSPFPLPKFEVRKSPLASYAGKIWVPEHSKKPTTLSLALTPADLRLKDMAAGLMSLNGLQHFMASQESITTIPSIHVLSPQINFRTTRSLQSNAATTIAVPAHNKGSISKTSGPASQKPRAVPYSVRQAAVIEIQQSSDLDFALARSGKLLKVQDLNIMLRNFGRLRRWKDLSQLFEWMQMHEKVNRSSYSSYIKFMGESMNLALALETYDGINDDSTRNNVSVCNSLLSCLVKSNKFDSAIDWFHRMKQNGLEPDAVTYSTLLAGCIKMKNGYSRALDLVLELENNGISMDSVIYGALIAVCAANGQCKEAERYFLRMKAEGHSPNFYHYSSLLNAYSADGNYHEADELVKAVKDAGLVPNKVMWTTLLKVYTRGGLFEKARLLLSELETLGYAGDEMPYCLLMDALSKSGQIHEAKLVFDEMNKRQVKSDGYAHSILISAFCRGGMLKEAKQLATDYAAAYDRYDLVILNTMLCAYCRVSDMENVMQTLRKMDQLAISPDQNTFHILIKYFCKEKLYLLACQTMQDMHSKGHQVVEDHCSSLISHLGKMGAHSEAFSVYNILRYSKRTLCKALHEKILHILIAGKLLKDAYVVVKDNGRSISQLAIKKFSTAFMKSGNINLINDVLKAIHASGHKIDQEVLQMAMSRHVGQPEKKELLLQLLQWMPSHGYVFEVPLIDSYEFLSLPVLKAVNELRPPTDDDSCVLGKGCDFCRGRDSADEIASSQ
ncbi:hypothetical protein Nepgr_026917 [Nepenthes gracilis]|uniref:Pentatricopeptide repeat-containing protein n=1 Tax=Nepenthes gracilis TaxID=150966 RepID=A0AAD3T991_NEPGR|nr:hypothetical protein Nepgr_026917 [Nepenthes gracilis]